jgi:hypothetical protein
MGVFLQYLRHCKNTPILPPAEWLLVSNYIKDWEFVNQNDVFELAYLRDLGYFCGIADTAKIPQVAQIG